ncbi:MAG: helix-turn-helix transcriptional regulator [Clostridia bacterium]|nr:helix-turn-helix transcriptional regulator [Clostridia bacterium]
MLLSERIKKFRLALGLTQGEVAQVLGVERTTYTYYERGTHKISVERIQALAKLFNTDVATLLGEEELPEVGFVLADDGVGYNEGLARFNELKKDEIMLVLYYRQLDKSKQAKLLRTVKEKSGK